MKNRVIWFLAFYIILFLFVVYNLAFLIVVWNNSSLLELYNNGFTIAGADKRIFNYSSAFAIYGLITIGTMLATFGVLLAVLSQSLILKASTPKRKLIALVSSFVILILGFYFGFIGQLFYNEWNDNSVMIHVAGKEPVPASHFYQNWMSLAKIWILFGVFFLFFVICILLIIKLHFSNLKWKEYLKDSQNEEMNLEIAAPFPTNVEFDPNETRTITLNLDTDKISAWKRIKKKDKIIKEKKKIKKK